MEKFFNSENPVMRFLARLVDLVILNVITILYSLPLITAGGALTAMNYVLLHLYREDESYVLRMFRKSFRENFRQGIPEGLLGLAAAAITAVDMLALHGSDRHHGDRCDDLRDKRLHVRPAVKIREYGGSDDPERCQAGGDLPAKDGGDGSHLADMDHDTRVSLQSGIAVLSDLRAYASGISVHDALQQGFRGP